MVPATLLNSQIGSCVSFGFPDNLKMSPTKPIAIIGLPASLPGVSACESEPSGTGGWGGENAATRVITTIIQPQRLVDEIQALGTAKAKESIEITPRISSVVTQVAFEEGQLVQKGDLLVEIENSEILAGLAVAEASLRESRSIYERSKSLIDTQVISASDLEQLQDGRLALADDLILGPPRRHRAHLQVAR